MFRTLPLIPLGGLQTSGIPSARPWQSVRSSIAPGSEPLETPTAGRRIRVHVPIECVSNDPLGAYAAGPPARGIVVPGWYRNDPTDVSFSIARRLAQPGLTGMWARSDDIHGDSRSITLLNRVAHGPGSFGCSMN